MRGDRQTDDHTYTLTAILRTAPGGELTIQLFLLKFFFPTEKTPVNADKHVHVNSE